MEVKLIEIRDKATFIPAMAVALYYRDEAERFLLRRAGYAAEQIYRIGCDCISAGNPEKPKQHGADAHAKDCSVYVLNPDPYVILCKLDGVEAEYDPFSWRNQRTMGCAHRFVIEHWKHIQPGQVVDVEYILGETSESKQSERL